jgi:ABC-type multidrug transport system ATPase subunit
MLFGVKSDKVKINILEGVSGVIKPCRLTLLLGPPGCGKSTLLRALAGQLDKSLKVQKVLLIQHENVSFFFNSLCSS